MSVTHFMVRVELRDVMHSAAEADQEILDTAMDAQGFSRWMTGSSGSAYRLPVGGYHTAGEYTRADVLERAKRAAAITQRRCSILVTEVVGFLWLGLDPVPEGVSTE
jgi:hypothetical protein